MKINYPTPMQAIIGLFFLLLTSTYANAQGTSCATATALTINAAAVAGTISDATINDPAIATGCSGGATSRDGWYSFTASGSTATVTCISNNRQLVLYAYSGTCASLTQINCANSNTTAGPQTEVMNLTSLSTGSTYFIRVVNSTANNLTINAISVSIPPANDNCSGAISLTPGAGCTPTSGTTIGATQSLAAISCSAFTGTADDDVWYSFTAANATQVVTVVGDATFDAVVDVRSGACNGTNIGCSDSSLTGGTETVNLSGLTVGTTYYIRIYSYDTTAGTFTVCVTTPTPPVNDNCAAAIGLTVNTGTTCSATTPGTSSYATQTMAGCSGTADDDVWFSFVASATTHAITVTPGTMTDAVFQLFSGGCAGLTNISCVNATTGTSNESYTFTGLTSGATYYVRVYSSGAGTGQGTFTVCVTSPPPPAGNDNCSGAVGLTVNPNLTCTVSTTGTTVSATQSLAGCAGTADDDVWFSFVATGTSHNITVTPGTMYDAVFEVFYGTCGTLTSFGCIDSTTGTSSENATLTGLTSGTTYYIRVYSYFSDTADQGSFSICVTTPVPLTNDNCATAAPLTVNSGTACTVNTTGTTVGATQSQVGCSGTADDDVWYSFVATNTKHNITVTPGTLYDPVFQVFSGSCGSLTSLACVDNTVGISIESTAISGLTVGATYYVRIYSYYGITSDEGTFTVCITTPVVCTAGNSTGTTDLGCPSVVAGGLGLNGADPPAISCTSAGCVDLEATYLQLGQPTSYTVQSIPYAPPYQFGCLANPVSVNNDDVWSPIINLPFNFCFYGNTYNKCIMSSNGVISFDTTDNLPGDYSDWELDYNLPNASLFLNSIFGVYQDIDPRVGGEVGWELITLNTGCRALVASWNSIPMFSSTCNSQLYSGMIVLYENTNIIDIYVKEKNVCSTWNDGNAVVGIQNAAGTVGTVAPSRNSLDANWTVTNEAWRFVPSGTSITSLKWYQGAGTTGPVVGTTNTINVCPVSTTVYTAEVTYTLCNGTTLKESKSTTVTVNSSKVWNGSLSSDWNTAANWTPTGVPTSADCIIIPQITAPASDPIISGTGYDAYGFSLRVLNGGNLTMNSANNLTITNIINVIVGGTFLIKDDASLIQVDPVANTGTVKMERTTTPVYRFDYTYWNSPMTLASNYTLGTLSQNLTQPDKYYHWTPSLGAGLLGDWAQESVATIMDPTKGYIIRAPNTYSFTPTAFATYTGTFSGTPNNGTINCPITYGSLAMPVVNDKWNLIGNPYPSAVSASLFLGYAGNVNTIDGTIYFWTHNSAISASFPDPFYGDFVLNYTDSDYAAWNTTGGTAASTGGQVPNGYIAAGQSFFVLSKSSAGGATFNNTMRVKNNNTQFFRTSLPTATPENGDGETPVERHRIWLNMTNTTSAFNQLLIGYVQGATPGWDRGLDGVQMNKAAVRFYSMIADEDFVIQGRPLPFDVNDQVPLGYGSDIADNYSIRIDHFDGLFDNQNIFIEDKLLNVIHNLKESPYDFTTEAGTFNDRFILRYTDNALGIDDHDPISGVTAFISHGQLHVRASEKIESIQVYDVAGKLIRAYFPGENANEFSGDFHYSQGVYLAKIKLVGGASGNRKLMN